MPRDLAELAYDISSARLDKQENLLGDVRARTGVVLGASSLAVSFLGRPAVDAEPVVLAILALIAFGVSVLTALYVLMPKENLIFSLVGSRVCSRSSTSFGKNILSCTAGWRMTSTGSGRRTSKSYSACSMHFGSRPGRSWWRSYSCWRQ